MGMLDHFAFVSLAQVFSFVSGSLFKLETRKGSIIQATKVVVCAGAFLGHNKLLPDGCRLDVRYRPALAIRIRVDPGPILDSLVKSPPLIFVYASSVKDGNESSIYTAPPIRYADGKDKYH